VTWNLKAAESKSLRRRTEIGYKACLSGKLSYESGIPKVIRKKEG